MLASSSVCVLSYQISAYVLLPSALICPQDMCPPGCLRDGKEEAVTSLILLDKLMTGEFLTAIGWPLSNCFLVGISWAEMWPTDIVPMICVCCFCFGPIRLGSGVQWVRLWIALPRRNMRTRMLWGGVHMWAIGSEKTPFISQS